MSRSSQGIGEQVKATAVKARNSLSGRVSATESERKDGWTGCDGGRLKIKDLVFNFKTTAGRDENKSNFTPSL